MPKLAASGLLLMGICFTHADPSFCSFRLVDFRMDDVCQGHGIDHHGLLSEPLEELATAL